MTMRILTRSYNRVVTAAMAVCLTLSPVAAAADTLDDLFARLSDPGTQNWQTVERELEIQMSLSGSPSADLLLRRGEAALEEQDIEAALDHLTALTDHAPDFAEGWNARAAAYVMAGLHGPAMDDLRRVLVLEPRHYGALAGLGALLEEQGRPEAALAAFREALAIHPHRPELRSAVARLERSTGGTSL